MLFSILGLIFVSSLPLINMNTTTKVTYNKALIETSLHPEIEQMNGELQLIVIFFWLIIIFTLISFIGIIIGISEKHDSLGSLIMLIGCSTILFSALATIFLLFFIIKVESLENFTIASMGPIPIKYAYIPLIMGFLSITGSSLYSLNAIPFSLKNLDKLKRKQKTDKKEKKEKPKKTKKKTKSSKTKEKEETKEDIKTKTDLEKEILIPKSEKKQEDMSSKVAEAQKKEEIEDWLKDEIKNVEKPKNFEEPVIKKPKDDFVSDTPKSSEDKKKWEDIEIPIGSPFDKKEIIDTKKEQEEIPVKEESKVEEISLEAPVEKPPVSSEKTQQKKDEIPTSESLEKALSSAIEKKQTERNGQIKIEKPVKKEEKPVEKKEIKPKEKETTKEEKKKPEETKPADKEEESKNVKNINVRCPQCKTVFTVKREGDITKIKCPKCGKEGVAK